MIKIGIIGTSFGAKVHLPAFQLDSRAKVVALLGRDAERTRSIAKEKGVQDFTDLQDFLNSDLDAISLALPPPTQAQMLKEILKFKKHVFIEKPVGLGFTKTKQLADALDQASVIHSMDFEFPLLPAWQSFHNKIIDLGELQHLKVNWHVRTSAFSGVHSWKPHLKEGGGSLSNLTCHTLHYCEWIMGSAQSLVADLGRDEMQTDIIMDFPNEKKAVLSVSMNTHFGNGHRIELFGEKGALVLENTTSDYMNGFTLKIRNANGEKIETFLAPSQFADGRVLAVNRVVKRFLDGIESGKLPWPNLHDGARNEFLLEACRHSNKTNQREDVNWRTRPQS